MRLPLSRLLAGLILVPQFGFISGLRANGGGYLTDLASTGAFKPFGVDQVEMVSEHLEIDLHIQYADIRIAYELHNPGPQVTVEAGFPSATPDDDVYVHRHSARDGTKLALGDLGDFELKADGETIPVKKQPENLRLTPRTPYPRSASVTTDGATMITAWHVFRLDFAPNQTRQLQVHYRNPRDTNNS